MIEVGAALLSAVLGVLIGALVTYYKSRWRWRQLRDILSFGDSEVIFVIPHREHEPDSIMPRVAAEDVLAMMNVLYLTTRAGLRFRFKLKDSKSLSDDDKKKNIVTIGGPEANGYTELVLQKAAGARVHFERDPSGKHFTLKSPAHATHTSPSLSVPDDAGVDVGRADVGILFKFRNPFNVSGDTIVVGFAGIRGIGTWAAADCLRKKHKQLHARKRSDSLYSKRGDFVAYVSAEYEKLDITKAEVELVDDFS